MFLQHLLAIPLLSLRIDTVAHVLSIQVHVHFQNKAKQKTRACVRRHLVKTFRALSSFLEDDCYLRFAQFMPLPLHFPSKTGVCLSIHLSLTTPFSSEHSYNKVPLFIEIFYISTEIPFLVFLMIFLHLAGLF